ncbi:unnamed protein product [Rotaria socialis]|uniref:Uncharacterized protein n=3 Tax=Rotaria socialis TaxID=392032 RepID=A0A817Z6Z6_9BILA|nr:unnamed protein product [Rotaria socialis]
MSSYSDANYHRSMIFQNQIRMNYIQTLNPKPQNFLLNLNRRRIICLILILLIIHLKLLIEAWKMLNEISSKDEYLHQQWLFEQEKIVNQKKNLQEFLNNLKSSSNESAKPCKKCFDSISKFYSKAISEPGYKMIEINIELVDDNRIVEAITFIDEATSEENFIPPKEYVQTIVNGAKAHKFPQNYINYIISILNIQEQ